MPTGHYDWKPTAREMAEDIRRHIHNHGGAAVGPILATVARVMTSIDYPIPVNEETMSSRRRETAVLIEVMADWFKNAWRATDSPRP